MIHRIYQVPARGAEEVFGSARTLSRLADHGYAEEEYFFDGTANVYERTEDGGKAVRFADAPYTSRFLLRRPERPEDFSGNIVIEIMNSTPGFDLDRSWIILREQLMRGGDAYIGLLSKPNVITTLKRFDPERYAPLGWPNPIRYDRPPGKGSLLPGALSPDTETGLFWDILMDVAGLVREPGEKNPLAELVGRSRNPVKVLLIGWSQSGAYIIRYMLDFAREEGRDCFDGYFSMGSAAAALPNLNQEDGTPWSDQELHIRQPDRPFIDMHTESENRGFGADRTRMENGPFYRIYDIAGPSHDVVGSMEGYYRGDTCLPRVGRSMAYANADAHPNSFPCQFPYHAALVMLEDWVRTGKEPPVIAPVEVDDRLQNVKDADGNSVGGWRIPQIDLPVCAYYGTSTRARDPKDNFSPAVYGREEPFAPEVLAERYHSLADYRRLLEERTDRCIEAGLLLAADRDASIQCALEKAEEYGLR